LFRCSNFMRIFARLTTSMHRVKMKRQGVNGVPKTQPRSTEYFMPRFRLRVQPSAGSA
jgi:hypothetical protein